METERDRGASIGSRHFVCCRHFTARHIAARGPVAGTGTPHTRAEHDARAPAARPASSRAPWSLESISRRRQHRRIACTLTTDGSHGFWQSRSVSIGPGLSSRARGGKAAGRSGVQLRWWVASWAAGEGPPRYMGRERDVTLFIIVCKLFGVHCLLDDERAGRVDRRDGGN